MHLDARGLPLSTAGATSRERSHIAALTAWTEGKLEYGDTAAVLDLYDTRFRNLTAALTLAAPDVYIDVQNAASMLFRLQRLGVNVGRRWEELADKAEARIGDCQSAFTLPHWLMAPIATGRAAAAQRMVEAMRAFAKGSGTIPPCVRPSVACTGSAAATPSRTCSSNFSWTPPSRPEAARISASSSSGSPVCVRFRPSASSAGAKLPIGRRSGRHSAMPARYGTNPSSTIASQRRAGSRQRRAS